MITLKDFMETVDYKVTEGSDYCWNCYGDNAYRLDSWNQDQEGHTVSIVFDTRTHVIYEVSAYDYKRERAYRLINPDFKDAHSEESQDRGVLENQAWDDVDYVDLEIDDDFLEKARAIVADEEYDTRVRVPIDFTDDELLEYMKMAHELDMTFNAFVEMALREAIEQHIKDSMPDIDFPIPKKKKKKDKK